MSELNDKQIQEIADRINSGELRVRIPDFPFPAKPIEKNLSINDPNSPAMEDDDLLDGIPNSDFHHRGE